MKSIIIVITLSAMTILNACMTNPPSIPKGYKTCSSNYDCATSLGEYCGFAGVDTYAVCKH